VKDPNGSLVAMKRYLLLLIEKIIGLPIRFLLVAGLILSGGAGLAQSYDASWTDITSATVNADNSLSKIGTASAWTAGAASYNVLPAGADGWVEFTFTTDPGTYVVGLSQFNRTVTNSSVEYGFYINSVSNIANVYETGVTRVSLAAPKSGNVYRIERVGNTISYYLNGQFLRSLATPGTALMIDVALAYGASPNVKCSFNAFRIAEKLTLPTIGNADGSLAIEAAGGVEPYTYSWSTGENTAVVNGKGRGTYTITVTDATGATRSGTYTLGYRVVWTDLTAMVVNDDNSVTTTTAGNWNAGAASLNAIEAGKDGWIEFVIPEVGSNYILGVSPPGNTGVSIANIFYGLYLQNTGVISVWEKNENRGQSASARAGDVLRISREGSSMKYYHNGRLLQTTVITADAASLPLEVDASCSIGTIPPVSMSASAMTIQQTMNCPAPGASDGSITANVVNGIAPYTYRWDTGETTATITGKPRGAYTVTVTDAEGAVRSKTINMGYAVQWTDLVNMSIGTDGVPVKPGASAWDAGVGSYNILGPNQDGWVEFTITQLDSRYMLGLSDINVSVDFVTIDYAVYVQPGGSVYVYESGTTPGQVGYARKGDIFRVSREGTFIRYYRNGKKFREVKALSGSLLIDASVGIGSLSPSTASFGGVHIEDQITYPKYGGSDGIIAANGAGGKQPYTYSWSTGETTGTIGSKPMGTYTLTVKDAEGYQATKSYRFGYPISWTDLARIRVNSDNSLFHTDLQAGWTSGAASRNRLNAGEAGWIEFEAGDVGSAYMVGFSKTNANASYTSIENAAYITAVSGLAIYESGVGIGTQVTVRKGDIIRVAREQDSVRYSVNGKVFRSVAKSMNESLLIDVANNLGTIPPVTSSFWLPGQEKVPDDIELSALKKVYDSLNGKNWTVKTNWPTTWPATATSAQFATWYGVTVVNGDVVGLSLNNNNLVGVIPGGMSALAALEQISFSGNQITGSIPRSFGSLINLKGLQLAKNSLSGPIPTEFSSLQNLNQLLLGGNQLTGSISPTLVSLSTLTQITLNDNKLTGTLPLQWSGQLQTLKVNNNQITGTIPTQLGALTGLTQVALDSNQFTGTIPVALTTLPQLTSLTAGYNQLSGSIPVEMGNAAALKTLRLQNNQLTGTIPAELGNLVALEQLALDNNQFTGPVPSLDSRLTNFKQLTISNNQLSGTIPSSLGGISTLTTLDLHGNTLSGEIPSALTGLSALQTLDLHSNLLTGNVPAGLASIATLKLVDVQSNELTGFANFSSAVNKANLKLSFSQNRISFDVMEQNMTGINQHGFSSLSMVPQKPFNEITRISVARGAVLTIPARSAGAHGTMIWEWQPVGSSTWTTVTAQNEDATQKTFKLSGFQSAKAGNYRYRMTNTWIPGTTLESVSILVTVGDYQAQWMDLTGVQQSNGILTRTASGNAWNTGANSSNLLKEKEDGTLQFVIDNTSSNYLIGFSNYTGTFNTAAVNYGIAVQQGQPLTLWENATTGVDAGAWQTGDTIRINRTGTQLTYYKNSTLLKTLTVDNSQELRVKAVIYNGTIPVVHTSFDIYLTIEATNTYVRADGTGGAVALSVKTGTSPYTYKWQTGETTAGVSNKSIGVYPVTVTDADGRSVQARPYRVGYMTNWIQAAHVSVQNVELVKQTADEDWTAGGVSASVLKGGEDGWLQFIVTGSTSRYMIGFSADASGVAPEGMTYGVEVGPGQPVIAWENDTESDLKLSGGWQVGDVFAISRVGNQIQYYRNGTSLRTVSTDGSQELHVKSLLYTGSSPAISTSFDQPLVLQVKFTPVRSYGLAGAIAVLPVLGTPPFKYSWEGRTETTPSLTNLKVGTYPLTVKDNDGRSLKIAYDLGYSVLWQDQTGVTGASDILTKTAAEGWNAGANAENTLHANEDGWVSVVINDADSRYMIGFATYSTIFNQAALSYGVAIQPGQPVSAWENAWEGVNMSSWQVGDVFKIARTGNKVQYYRNGDLLRTVDNVDPSQELRIKSIVYSGTTGQVQASMPAKSFAPGALNIDSVSYKIPDEVKVSRDGRLPKPPVVRQFLLDELNEGDAKELFQAPPCLEGSYYAGFQLFYDLGDRNTQEDWTAYVQVTLFHNDDSLWTKPVQLSMKDQTFIATAFYDSLVSCDQNYYFHIDFKTLTGNVPQQNIYLKVLLYQHAENNFNPTAQLQVDCAPAPAAHETLLHWDYTGKGETEYDVEWVFVDKYEDFSGAADSAFRFKEPARITTAMHEYKHVFYFPTGKIWYRVRAVGYDPEHPEHRIVGNWWYFACGPVDVENHQKDLNWQEQTVFAEEGKFKKIMSYFDGTMRQRQGQTNLSTENVTLVGETMYDFEGRAAVNVLAVPDVTSSLTYRPSFNVFQEASDQVIKDNTSPVRTKFNYDNRKLENSVLANTSGASKYYSANNASNSIHRDYIPEGKGYVYSQTQYTNDGTGRVTKQSNVGEEFRIDGPHAVQNAYGTAAKEELIRLFGSNAGKASHYKKNLSVDANGQVSVSYIDQHDHVVATALAGDAPANVEALDSYKNLDTAKLTVNLADKNVKQGGISSTTHTLLNVTPETAYIFQYDLSAYGANIASQCLTCRFDLVITLSDPDGVPVDLSQAAGNQVAAGGTSYERKNISAQSCTTATVANTVNLNVVLHDIGNYTITKTLRTHELSYEDMSAFVMRDSSVQVLISQITNSYVVDSSKCEICTQVCPEADSILNKAMEEIAQQDCENIYRQIEQYYQDEYAKANPDSEEIYVVPDSLIKTHPMYCKYYVCAKNEASDVFEKKLVTEISWDDVKQDGLVVTNYTDLLNADPFFSDEHLSGYGKADKMKEKLDRVTLGSYNNHDFVGTVDEVTDPANTNFYIDASGNPDPANGKHILYQDALGRKAQLGDEAYNAEVSRARWAIYRSFYLEAKRRVKIEQVADYNTCPAALEQLTAQDTLPKNQDEMDDAIKNNPVPGPASQEDLEMTLSNLKFACATKFSPEDSLAMTGYLRSYFDNHQKNFFRFIFLADVGSDESLIAIDSILKKYNCGLDSIAVGDPLICLNEAVLDTDPAPPQPSPVPIARMADANDQPVEFDTEALSSVDRSSEGSSEQKIILVARKAAMRALVTEPASMPTQTEYNALMALYDSLGGTQWHEQSGWSDAAKASVRTVQHVYNWPGIMVDQQTGHILEIDMPRNLAKGKIPAAVNDLIYLKKLDFGCISDECYDGTGYYKNTISGIPGALDRLVDLEILDLGQNPLNIPLSRITASISNSSKLDFLNLSSCGIKGPFTESIGMFPVLTNLWLSGNPAIADTIPQTIGNLQKLEYLYLSGNSLQGRIPDTLCTVGTLIELDLSGNQLQGAIPRGIGNWIDLEKLLINSNAFNDSIPNAIGGLQNLKELNASDAKIINPLPLGLWRLSELTTLNLASNLLTDSIPHGLGDLTNLEHLTLSSNKFKNAFPKEIGNLTKLITLDASYCDLRYGIPEGLWGLSLLQSLNLNGNPKVTNGGPLSHAIGGLKSLMYFYMTGDSIGGPLPKEFGDITHLYQASFTQNNITYLPESIGNLKELVYFEFANNKITNIPDSIGYASSLVNLYLFNNQITDSIPKSIGKLSQLVNLGLYMNQISGKLPVELGNLRSLRSLQLQINNISGPIPESLGTLSSVYYFNLSNNQLTGGLPQSLWSHVYAKPSGTGKYGIIVDHNKLSEVIPSSFSLTPPPPLYLYNNAFTFEDLVDIRQRYASYNQIAIVYDPQDYVDKEKVVPAKDGRTVVLSPAVDLNVSGCTYTWYLAPSGTYTSDAIRIPPGSDNTLSLTMSKELDGTKYFYIIQNPTNVPNLTIYSRMQTLKFEEAATICLEYDSTNTTLALFDYDVDWSKEIQKCLDNAAKEDSVLTQMAVNKLVEEKVGDYYAAYRTACVNGLNEALRYMYHSKEYHYTLYYYDQAGNLVQTVPPKGVSILGDTAVQRVIAGKVHYPAHGLETRYKYDSENHIVSDHSSDAGNSRSWYNSRGQLRFSQSAQQLIDGTYSYTKYDEQERVIEVGEMVPGVDFRDPVNKLNDDSFPNVSSGQFNDVSRTYYDFVADRQLHQENLRGRVSYTEVISKFLVDTVRTYYSYDIHGNVSFLVQALPGLEPKRIDYVYDVITGNVSYVMYQYGQTDEFIHHYVLDSDNRLSASSTSSDGFIWDQDVDLKFYAHGPLARQEFGEYKLQGHDYVYNLQGWAKGLNGVADPGSDGIVGSSLPKDQFSYTLGYFQGDYKTIGASDVSQAYQMPTEAYRKMYGDRGVFNGNISWSVSDLPKIGQVKGDRRKSAQGMLYRYDQLNRLKEDRSLIEFDGVSAFAERVHDEMAYDETFEYDENGNHTSLIRRDSAGGVMDKFNYSYYRNTNKLRQVVSINRTAVFKDSVVTSDQKVYQKIIITGKSYVRSGTDVTLKAIDSILVSDDFKVEENAKFRAYVLPDEEGMYLYDADGNLTWNQEDGVKIAWNFHGKVREVSRGDTVVVKYSYDGAGNRIEKRVEKGNQVEVTRYIRDVKGNIQAIYNGDGGVTEYSIYGPERIGAARLGRRVGHRTLGLKKMELGNHLGNVMVVIADNIYHSSDSSWVRVLKANDYYAFGKGMSGRSWGEDYRFGFNGKEMDSGKEFGSNVYYDYGFRIYNPTIGRFLSVDPLRRDYPWNSTYAFAENDVIRATDLEGLEKLIVAPNFRKQFALIKAISAKDPVLNKMLIADISKKELEAKVHVYIANVKELGGDNAVTWSHTRLLEHANNVINYENIPFDDVPYDQQNIFLWAQAKLKQLNVTATELIENDKKGIKSYAVVINPSNPIDKQIKTYGHETDLHLKDLIKQGKSTREIIGKQHRRGFGDDYYDKNNVSDWYSPEFDKVDPNSHMGRLFKRIDNAIKAVNDEAKKNVKK